MADSMLTAAGKLDKFESAVYFTLYREIWSLFPKFCQNLTDGPYEFLKPAYAKGLNSILESKQNHHLEIKQFILTGLRKLAMFSCQDGNEGNCGSFSIRRFDFNAIRFFKSDYTI